MKTEPPPQPSLMEQAQGVRQFNRFYTVHLGLLRRHYLDSDYALSEGRILYELSLHPASTASALGQKLGLDGGYMSRLLRALTGRGLVAGARAAHDRRSTLLSLTAAGRATAALLADATALLHAYFDAVGVLLRDDAAAILAFLNDAASGLWIAYVDGVPAGCVALRSLPGMGPAAAECKRLYVDPRFRRRGLAELLVGALEAHAHAAGYDTVYLDSKDDLQAALALYGRLGYVACPRYNDNPQATVFMRKALHAPQ